MSESNISAASEKVRYSYLENIGCMLFFIVGGICSAATAIMKQAFDANSGMAGAVAVVALSAMGVGVCYLLVRTRVGP